MTSEGPGFALGVAEIAARLPLPATDAWPEGVTYLEAFSRHGLDILLFAPDPVDHQTPHQRDELYVVARGSARFVMAGEERPVTTGDLLFVPAGVAHHFHAMADGFATWAIFFGPRSG